MAEPEKPGPISLEEINDLLDSLQRSSLSLYNPQFENDKLTNGPNQGVYIPNSNASINRSGIGNPTGVAYPNNSQPTADVQIWGRDRARRASARLGSTAQKLGSFYGQCDGFNAVVLAIVTAKNSPLKKDRLIERFGFTGKVGHAFMVIGRDQAGDLQDPHTWGADCIIIDCWFALQDGTVFVKKPASRLDDAERILDYYQSIKTKNNNIFKIVDTWKTGSWVYNIVLP